MTTTHRIDQPEPGYYRLRWRRGTPWQPVRIWRQCQCTVNGPDAHDWTDACDRFPLILACRVGNKDMGPLVIWTWCCGNPIDKAEYQYMISVASWAKTHDPAAPEANPDDRIDLGTMEPLY